MILISIQPFAFAPKKMLALLIGLICLANVSAFASSLFMPVDSTPYDRQMSRIRPVLLTKASRGQVSLATVNQWMEDLRGIPYAYHLEWKTPSEVQSGQPADCKGKAVALYERMQARGAGNVRLVIGKRAPTSRMTHAWLVWETSEGEFVLDPTFNWMATRSETLGDRSYVPLYAYTGSRKFRAASASTLLAKN